MNPNPNNRRLSRAEREARTRLRLQSAHFRKLARQLQQCRAYIAKADRIGNRSDAYRDRKAELSRVVTELQALGAWDNRELYEGGEGDGGGGAAGAT